MSERPTSGPAPRYGEYGPVPVPVEPPVPVQEKPVDPVPTAGDGGAGARRPERSWDRALTIGLLAVGGVNLLWSIPQFADFGPSMREVFQVNGFGVYTSDTLAASLGPVAIIGQLLILLAAVFFARRNLAAGRISFWIPLVAAVFSLLVVTVVVLGAMLPDPAMQEWFQSQMAATMASQMPSAPAP